MDSLLTLIDRWHVHERDSDPEADEARRALELRLASLEGIAIGLTMVNANMGSALQRYIGGS